jgi:hypothetical protein
MFLRHLHRAARASIIPGLSNLNFFHRSQDDHDEKYGQYIPQLAPTGVAWFKHLRDVAVHLIRKAIFVAVWSKIGAKHAQESDGHGREPQ